jgi:hypothetical protein
MLFGTVEEARAVAKRLAAASGKPWVVWCFPEAEDFRVNSGTLLRTLAMCLPVYEEINLQDVCLSNEKIAKDD